MTPEQLVIGWSRTVVGQPFEWGRTDCAMLTLVALDLLTGRDYASAYRGLWGSQAEALAHFALETPSAVLQGFGAEEVPAAYAVLGDVLTVPADPWPETLHFVLGRHCLSSSQNRGVGLAPTRAVAGLAGARVWRVAKCLRPYH